MTKWRCKQCGALWSDSKMKEFNFRCPHCRAPTFKIEYELTKEGKS